MSSDSKKGASDLVSGEDQIVQEIIKQRLEAVQRGHQADYSKVDVSVVAVLEQMGIVLTPKSQNPLYVKMKELLGLTKDQLDGMPYISDMFQQNADIALNELLEVGEGVECLLVGNYARIGLFSNQSFFCGGRVVPHAIAAILRFESKPHLISFEFNPIKRVWDVTMTGEECKALLKALDKKITELSNRLYKGKELDSGWNLVTLRRKSRQELIYPPGMGKQIDDLCTAFKGWETSASVNQWSCILTGDVGCGKTTVGGLLVGIRDKDCTVMYCHATDLQQSGEIERAFKNAKKMAPTLLIMDDLHLLFAGGLHESVMYTGVLMECLDSLREKDAKVFILFTANNPEILDPALKNRPGRISCKIHFSDYFGCLCELLVIASKEASLQICEAEIQRAVDLVPEENRVLSPDEARNVCQTLHLLYGDEAIAAENLKDAIIRVFNEYHVHAAQAARSEEKVRKKLGEDPEF